MPRKIAIFGATSAIASEVARIYSKRGEKLYLVGRDPSKLAHLIAELGDAAIGSETRDFDDLTQADACVARAIDALGSIDVALIAHGWLGDQLESERDIELAARIVHTNYSSVMALVIALANHLERAGQGHLAVLSTVAAERGRPRNYTYAAAKAALNTYLEGLRSRLYRSGVRIHLIKLGPVDTPMTAGHRKNVLFARVPEVAQQIVAAIDSGVFEVYVPSRWRPIMFVVRNLPEFLFQRIGGLSRR